MECNMAELPTHIVRSQNIITPHRFLVIILDNFRKPNNQISSFFPHFMAWPTLHQSTKQTKTKQKKVNLALREQSWFLIAT